jgi:N-acetyl-anhydromuramyl-L-alanine amidase AmpD
MNPELQKRLKPYSGFPVDKETYLRPSPPTQICLHFTASGPGEIGDITWWERDGQPVSTPIIVGRDGTAVQLYSSTRWAYSLGLNHWKRKEVEAKTIGLEIDTWGGLVKRGEKFYAWPNKYTTEVPAEEVCILDKPHKGNIYYHKFTDEQIETVKLLLQHWGATYNIPLTYVGDNAMFNLHNNAMYAFKPGVYSHNSFRSDKADIHPQPNMVEMLKSL